MRKLRTLGLFVVLLAVASALPAATIQSDNFDDGVIGAQWAAPVTTGTASATESGGTLNMVSTTIGSNGTLDTASGYVLSGDFDVTVDLNIGGWVGGSGTLVYAGMAAKSGSKFISLQHRNAGMAWYEISFITGGSYAANTEAKDFQTPYSVQQRIVRVGGTATSYFKCGTDYWVSLNTDTTFGTDDATLELYTDSLTGSTLLTSFDNLVVVPEPTTMGLLGIGGLLTILRRRR